MVARLIMKMRVAQATYTTRDVLLLTLNHPRRAHLPEWTPGAHVDLRLPDGQVRQYSLCGNPSNLGSYQIAVKYEAEGRGGSIWIHKHASQGAEIHVSAPRNNLPLVTDADRYVLVAGGIGVTPMVPMAHSLVASGKPFELHYCARSPDTAPLLDELRAICGESLRCWFSSTGNRYDPAVIGAPENGTVIYVCGPQRLLDAVQEALAKLGWSDDRLNFEVFQPTIDENFKAEPFYAEIASTGEVFLVPADQSLLGVLRLRGFVLPSSCELGICGSCECGFRDGSVIHRDKILPSSRRQHRMLPCVSRARVSVTLDL